MFHYFNEVDTLKELSSDDLVSFFNEVDIEDKLSSEDLVSFFNELDTRKKTLLRRACFIC